MNPADFKKWKRKQGWTNAQAAFVLAGIEPPPLPTLTLIDEAGAEVRGLYDDLKMAFRLKKIDFGEAVIRPGNLVPLLMDRVAEPSAIVIWARGMGFAIPPELESLAPAKKNESPEERKKRLLSEVTAAKQKRIRNFNETVAEREGISVSRLKQILYD